MLETQPFINFEGLTFSLDESIDYFIDWKKHYLLPINLQCLMEAI